MLVIFFLLGMERVIYTLKATESIATRVDKNVSSKLAFVADCISRIESNIGDTLIKRGRSMYCTQDRTKGYVFSVSKAY